jgi:hypothetical protein
MLRRCDQYVIDIAIVQDASIILNHFSAGELRGLLCTLVIYVGNRQHVAIVGFPHLHQRLHVIRGLPAAADHADAQAFVRARNLGISQRGNRRG